jgi:hypothetical protein
MMRQVVELTFEDNATVVAPDMETALERVKRHLVQGSKVPTFASEHASLAAAGIDVPQLHVLSHLASLHPDGHVGMTVHDLDSHLNNDSAIATYVFDSANDPDSLLSRAILAVATTDTGDAFLEDVEDIRQRLVAELEAVLQPLSWLPNPKVSDWLAKNSFWQPPNSIVPTPEILASSTDAAIRETIVEAATRRLAHAVEIVAIDAGIDPPVQGAPSI